MVCALRADRKQIGVIWNWLRQCDAGCRARRRRHEYANTFVTDDEGEGVICGVTDVVDLVFGVCSDNRWVAERLFMGLVEAL